MFKVVFTEKIFVQVTLFRLNFVLGDSFPFCMKIRRSTWIDLVRNLNGMYGTSLYSKFSSSVLDRKIKKMQKGKNAGKRVKICVKRQPFS